MRVVGATYESQVDIFFVLRRAWLHILRLLYSSDLEVRLSAPGICLLWKF